MLHVNLCTWPHCWVVIRKSEVDDGYFQRNCWFLAVPYFIKQLCRLGKQKGKWSASSEVMRSDTFGFFAGIFCRLVACMCVAAPINQTTDKVFSIWHVLACLYPLTSLSHCPFLVLFIIFSLFRALEGTCSGGGNFSESGTTVKKNKTRTWLLSFEMMLKFLSTWKRRWHPRKVLKFYCALSPITPLGVHSISSTHPLSHSGC